MIGRLMGTSRSSGVWSGVTITSLVATLLLAPLPRVGASTARAEGGLVTILKDGLYGGATGLLLGAVIALVVDSDHRDDSVRWGIVLGTFGGCAYGIYDISHDGFAARTPEKYEPVAVRLAPLVPAKGAATTSDASQIEEPPSQRVNSAAPLSLRAEITRASR